MILLDTHVLLWLDSAVCQALRTVELCSKPVVLGILAAGGGGKPVEGQITRSTVLEGSPSSSPPGVWNTPADEAGGSVAVSGPLRVGAFDRNAPHGDDENPPKVAYEGQKAFL